MSRRLTRARRRRARFEEAEAEFSRLRGDPKALAEWLHRVAATDTPIWPIAKAASRSSPLDDAERAMVAQTVAPSLAGMTPNSVWGRPLRGRTSRESDISPGG